jgi:squalene-hopene/tetraprenyl-beta-curcumene cyclase
MRAVRCLRFLCALLLFCPALPAQDTKAVADDLCHQLRELQRPEGGYGEDLASTCQVLDVLGRSPRRYTELDGPFMRNAMRLVAAAAPGEVPDALIALGLAGALSPDLLAARDAALARLELAPPRADYATLLALHALRPRSVAFPVAVETSDPGLACLLAENPATVPAPPVSDVRLWTRWARAARLRKLQPTELPPLSEIVPGASLQELVDALETVIQLHGLLQPPAPPPASVPDLVAPGQTLSEAAARAAAFLDERQQGGTFGLDLPGWSGPEPGITALCLSAALKLAELRSEPRPKWIEDGLDYLVNLQRPDGSIHAEGLDVYTTSVAIEALVLGGREGDAPAIQRARDFLVIAQSDEGEGYESELDAYYGGVGYGGDERPDLSNTQMALDAATRAGLPSDHDFFRKARVFLERCQNLSEAGAQSWPRPGGGTVEAGNDGGAVYMPGNSPAGELKLREGVYQARSYGSMTYALVKSYLFCDVPRDDPRLTAAVRWLGANFTVERNPGFEKPEAGGDGLYYYYLAMARTLQLLPEDSLRDAAGAPIDWQVTLTRHLLDNQRTDGSWINEQSPRWWEGAPTLCTAYAVLALAGAN